MSIVVGLVMGVIVLAMWHIVFIVMKESINEEELVRIF